MKMNERLFDVEVIIDVGAHTSYYILYINSYYYHVHCAHALIEWKRANGGEQISNKRNALNETRASSTEPHFASIYIFLFLLLSLSTSHFPSPSTGPSRRTKCPLWFHLFIITFLNIEYLRAQEKDCRSLHLHFTWVIFFVVWCAVVAVFLTQL